MEDNDRLLDEALRSYVAEPRPGLEGRVLAGMRPRPGLRRWAWLIPVLACLLPVAVLLREPGVDPPPRPEVARAEEPPPLPEPAPRVVAAARGRAALPRRAEFFRSGPLSNEERALLAFVREAPEQMLPRLGEPIEPIRIDEIKIEPLKINGTE